jgi:hypothetical protein
MPPNPYQTPQTQGPAPPKRRRRAVYWLLGILLVLAAILIQFVMSVMGCAR